jgi:DNA-binding PadR family transcriptional regulator
LFLSSNVYSKKEGSYIKIVTAIEKLCKAPSNKKSTYYQITARGKAELRVKILGLVGGDANFKQKEWIGVQRVLQKDQLNDNQSYRNCTIQLTPIFLKKFHRSVEMAIKKESLKNNIPPNSQTTYGTKSPIINNTQGNVIIN